VRNLQWRTFDCALLDGGKTSRRISSESGDVFRGVLSISREDHHN
jgi:hypothetical protein